MKSYLASMMALVFSLVACGAEPVMMLSLNDTKFISPPAMQQAKKFCDPLMKEQSCSELGTIAEDDNCFCRPANAQKVVMNYQDGCRGEKIEENDDCRQASWIGGQWDDSSSPLMMAIWEGPGSKILENIEVRICYYWTDVSGELFTCFTGRLNMWFKFELATSSVTKVSVSHPALVDRDIYFRFYGGEQRYVNELRKARFWLDLR